MTVYNPDRIDLTSRFSRSLVLTSDFSLLLNPDDCILYPMSDTSLLLYKMAKTTTKHLTLPPLSPLPKTPKQPQNIKILIVLSFRDIYFGFP